MIESGVANYACGCWSELCSHYLQPSTVPQTFEPSTKSKLKNYSFVFVLMFS